MTYDQGGLGGFPASRSHARGPSLRTLPILPEPISAASRPRQRSTSTKAERIPSR